MSPKTTRHKEVALAAQQSSLAESFAQPRGLELGSDNEDLTLPRVKLLQPLSPEVQEAGHKPGILINSITGEKLTTDEFLPLLMIKEFIKWRPREDGGGIEWKSTDPLDARVKEGIRFGEDGEKPEVTAFINFLAVFGNDFSCPLVIPFCKTSYKTGRKLYSMARLAHADLFARKYRLVSKKITNDKGTYWVLDVEVVGKATPDEVKQAESVYLALAPQRDKIQTHYEEPTETAGI